MLFYIDVVGSCNLRCPSCPVENSKTTKRYRHSMSPELLDKIVSKAVKETHVRAIALFVWTEPLLHPHLPELIRVVKKHHLRCYISSNLNYGKNIAAIIAKNPTKFIISVSGFTQETYGITHKGGNIEIVKENMIRLAEAKKTTNANTHIEVSYHRYLGNLDDEVRMRVFSESLGFCFTPIWAYLTPLEKVLAFTHNEMEQITTEDQKIIAKFALPVKESINIAMQYKNTPCEIRDTYMVLDCMGHATLCCTIYDQQKYSLGSYLDTPLRDLQKRKYTMEQNKAICSSCMEKGLHVLARYGAPELDDLGKKNIAAYYQKATGINLGS